jgi:hypothetical protein
MNTSQTLGQRITRNTFFLKRVLPALIFGTLTLAIFMPLAFGARHPAGFPYPVLVGPLVMIVIFYIVFRRLIFDLADEVTDEGDALRVRFGQEEERIPFEQIMNVSYTGMMNPPRITLMLRSPGRFGREIAFSPQRRFIRLLSNSSPLVNELIERVDAARRR